MRREERRHKLGCAATSPRVDENPKPGSVSRLPPVEITVYPYECDAYGHLNEAAYLTVFERARWEALARGPGADLFKRHGVWPAVRSAAIEFLKPAFPGDVLSVDLRLESLGRTSLAMAQSAVRVGDGSVLAEAKFTFVMVDPAGKPVAVPDEVAAVFGVRVSTRPGEMVRYDVGGLSLAVDIRGDGPALLLVHGFPLDRTLWAHQVATLGGWRRIAPDLRGMGLSDAPADGYSIAAYADDLVRLLDRLRAKQAVVAGLSMGGYIAFELLRRYRDRVAGLILVDTRADADGEEGRAGRDAVIRIAQAEGSRAVAERMLPRVLGRTTQQTQPVLVEQVREMMARAPVAGVIGALGAMRDRADSTPLLPSIDCPTLVVVGQEDEMTPPSVARALADAIPSAALTMIPSAGHLSPLEAPTAVSRVLAEFLEHARGNLR
jgi:YbgC/YbaW family acyl-CoA thioester hydrolase